MGATNDSHVLQQLGGHTKGIRKCATRLESQTSVLKEQRDCINRDRERLNDFWADILFQQASIQKIGWRIDRADAFNHTRKVQSRVRAIDTLGGGHAQESGRDQAIIGESSS